MPVETDLKTAYRLLYDAKDPENALKLYDSILSQSPSNLVAHIYKAACLEKLYYGFKDWHNQQTLANASDLLDKASGIAKQRGDRSKQGLVNFRFFVHYFNRKHYLKAKEYLDQAKALGYQDDTLPMWELNLSKKLKKLQKKNKGDDSRSTADVVPETTSKLPESVAPSGKPSGKPSFKVDWYQSSKTITISIFTTTLPSSKDAVKVTVASNNQDLELSYSVAGSDSEFQYSVKLAHPVQSEKVSVDVFTKKLEISLQKKETLQWKQLEDDGSSKVQASKFPMPEKDGIQTALKYPSSSKKTIDWSKLDLDDEQETSDNADAFFQQLYANADPDTKRAMMKSFVESNGTALNTNWGEVSEGKVEASPPEGLEIKKW